MMSGRVALSLQASKEVRSNRTKPILDLGGGGIDVLMDSRFVGESGNV